MKVKLGLHVKGTDEFVWIERTIDIPFAPWVGLDITGLSNESSDMCEHTVEAIWWNVADECFCVRLKADDCDRTGRTSQEIVDADYPEWDQES